MVGAVQVDKEDADHGAEVETTAVSVVGQSAGNSDDAEATSASLTSPTTCAVVKDDPYTERRIHGHGARISYMFPKTRMGYLSASRLKKLGLTQRRMQGHDALFFTTSPPYV